MLPAGQAGVEKKEVAYYTGLLLGPHKYVRFYYQGSANNIPKLKDC